MLEWSDQFSRLLRRVKVTGISKTIKLQLTLSMGPKRFLFLLTYWCSVSFTLKAFEIGKTYSYSYEGQLKNGRGETEIKQASGYGIRATLALNWNSDKEVVFQLSNVTLAPFNRKVKEFFEFFTLSYEADEKDKNALSFLQELETPFWAEFHQGLVTQTEFPEDSKQRTVNLKNAIASLFQINIDTNGKKFSSLFFTTLEDSILGLCPTTYQITPKGGSGREAGSGKMSVTKIPLFNQCQQSPRMIFSSVDGRPCGDCHTELLKTVGQTVYDIRPSENETVIIEKIASNSITSFSPFGKDGHTVVSITNQTLTLNSIDDNEPFEKPSEMDIVTPLHFQFNGDGGVLFYTDLSQPHYYDRVYRIPYRSHVKEAEDTINQIVEDFNYSGIQSKSFLKLIDEMTYFGFEDFVGLFEKKLNIFRMNSSLADKELKSILLELLPYIGTNPAVTYILKIIKTVNEPEIVLSRLLIRLPYHVKEPSDTLIDHYVEFLQNSLDRRKKLLYHSAWLTFGTLLYRGCVKSPFNRRPTFLPTYLHEEQCSFRLQTAIENFYSSSGDIRAIFLRAICNTRLAESFSFLKKIVLGNYTTKTRIIAIKGLINLIEDKKEQIVSTLLSVLLSIHEEESIRIAAFDVLLRVVPTSDFLADLVHRFSYEPRVKILADYVYSTLIALANSTYPCHRKASEHAQFVLKYLVNNQQMQHRVLKKIVDINSEKYKFAICSQFTVFPNNRTFLPRKLSMREDFNILGYEFNSFQWTFHHENFELVDLILISLLEKDGLVGTLNEQNITETHKKFVEFVTQMQRNSFQFNLTEEYFSEVLLAGSLEEFNPTSFFSEFSSHQQKEDNNVRYNKLMFINIEYIIPNDMGLSFHLQLEIPAIIKSRGSYTWKADASSSKILVGKIPSKFNVDLDLTFGLDFLISARMFVENPLLQKYGYQVISKGRLTFPLQCSLDFDIISRHTFDVKHAPSGKQSLVFFESDATTFSMNNSLPVVIDDYIKVSKKTLDLGYSYLGIGLSLNLTFDPSWSDHSPQRHFEHLLQQNKHLQFSSFIETWFAGFRQSCDYLLMNPKGKYFFFSVYYSSSERNPTNELTASLRKSSHRYYDDEKARKERWSFTKYDLEVVANGPIERKWMLEVHTSAQAPPEQWKRVRIHFQRTSLPGFDEEPLALCITHSSQTFFSQMFLWPLKLKQQQPFMNFQISLTMGKNCMDEKNSMRITVNGDLTKSEEQLSTDRSKLICYQKCLMDYAEEFELSPSCWKVKRDLGRLDQLQVRIQHSGLQVKLKDLFLNLHTWLHKALREHADYEEAQYTSVKKNDFLKLSVNIGYREPVLDVRIANSQKEIAYNGITTKLLPQMESPTIAEPFLQVFLRNVFNYQKPMCFLSGDFIRTVEQGTYRYPLSGCFHLALGDCVSKRFLVFYKGEKHGKFTKALKIFFDEDMIDIAFKDRQTVLSVLVNGRLVTTNEYVKFMIENGEKKEKFIIYPYWQGYVVQSNFYDILVFFDGRNARMMLSDFFRGKQCGLCGPFGKESSYSFRDSTC